MSVGLHVALGEWELVDGEWRAVEAFAREDAERIAAAVSLQLEAFRVLVGRDPTHLDSHQHAHRSEPARSLLVELARELRVPLREVDPRVSYSGRFYGQSSAGEPRLHAISVDALVEILRSLSAEITELACHPAETVDFTSMYADERPRELATLCHPRVLAAIEEEGVELVSFTALQAPINR
jgi:predicted glycoside hydrolase/deacetylase ChbG (UPF0249 family)